MMFYMRTNAKRNEKHTECSRVFMLAHIIIFPCSHLPAHFLYIMVISWAWHKWTLYWIRKTVATLVRVERTHKQINKRKNRKRLQTQAKTTKNEPRRRNELRANWIGVDPTATVWKGTNLRNIIYDFEIEVFRRDDKTKSNRKRRFIHTNTINLTITSIATAGIAKQVCTEGELDHRSKLHMYEYNK